MEQAFGRIAAVFVAAFMFCIVPLLIVIQQKEGMLQLAIMQETVQFVDSVRNTGILTEEMYESYQNQIRRLQGGLEVLMVHTKQSIHIGANGVERVQKLCTEKEITSYLSSREYYSFSKGDYLRVEVQKQNAGVYVYYGGSIRYEVK